MTAVLLRPAYFGVGGPVRITISAFFSGALLLPALWLVCSWPASASDEVGDARPNVIFIMADDMGYGDLGAFGSKHIKTPNIDRLASEGTAFTNFYAGGPVCAPSRDVLMTGRHTGRTLFRSNTPRVGGEVEAFGEGTRRISLTGEEATVAAALRKSGYVTAITGKWGLGEPGSGATPVEMGFDRWLGYLNQNHANYYYPDYLWRNTNKLPIPENSGAYNGWFLREYLPDPLVSTVGGYLGWGGVGSDGDKIYSNDLMHEFALDFIRNSSDTPFFLYLPFTIPHKFMEVPSLGEYEDMEWSLDARIYAAMVSRLDGYVGELMAELERVGIADNTLLVFTSDNGPVDNETTRLLSSAGPFRGTKGTLYEGGLRVPMIVKWPGRVAAGAVQDAPWMFVDVFPTLLDIAGGEVAGDLDGLSVLSTMLGDQQPELAERFLYWEFPRDQLWQAGRMAKWKAVRNGLDGAVQLYDLSTDPAESRDVSLLYPDLITSFAERLTREHTPSPYWPD